MSLVDVQLSVARAINRDKIDVECISEALKGHTILIEGDLWDKDGQVVKTLDGAGSCYDNFTQGVAHMYGIPRRVGDGIDELLGRVAQGRQRVAQVGPIENK